MVVSMETLKRREISVTRIVPLHREHCASRASEANEWAQYSMEERIAAVWEITLASLAWGSSDAGEPRLQRSVCRIERRGG
jgi:hypothetical protein